MNKHNVNFVGLSALGGAEVVQVGKFTVRASIVDDADAPAPWDREDGHGEVSEWTTRSKRPGELTLCRDGDSSRYYDFQGAKKIAVRDGWGCASPEGLTLAQQAADAAREDFERLKAWCEDQWSYVGVVLDVSAAGIELGNASLWGIESDAGDYLAEVARELLPEALADARAKLAELATLARANRRAKAPRAVRGD